MSFTDFNKELKKIIDNQYNQTFDFLGKLIEYADDVDAILKDVAKHYDADRAYVFEISKDRKTLDNTYEWCKDGVEPQIEVLQKVPYESVDVWIKEFERVGAFFISSLDKDVEANSLTYEILEPQGIESLITAPIHRDNKISGFVGVDNPHKNTDDIVILKAASKIINSELSRKIASKNKEIEAMTQAKQQKDVELGEIKDIISSADMGTWRIELVENEKPRMYVDETMKKLLGIEKIGTPEKTYDDWFSNITPEALDSVLRSVSIMESGTFDENTYLWKHPTKGVRYVRCGGTSKRIDGGYSLQGYHYDVDEVVRKNEQQMIELQKALSDKNNYFTTLGALGDIFYSLHTIDLLNDTFIVFTSRGKVKSITDNNAGAKAMMSRVINNVIIDEHKEIALKFTDLSTIQERMANKKVIYGEFMGKNIGWFSAMFVTLEQDSNGIPTKIIYATRAIDEEKKEKEKLIKISQTDELTGFYNRRSYENVIYENNDIPVEEHFVYVSFDVNGLKIVNDTLGHTAGDELLIGACSCIRKVLGSKGMLYRLGGDEFVAIVFVDDIEIKKLLTELDQVFNNWKGKLVDSVSVSYGYVSKAEYPDYSVRQLAAKAEERMYLDKDKYYHNFGYDRRGQQEAHKALCALYTKILKINITEDSYQIINMPENEKIESKGFTNKISTWMSEFGKSGQVHPDDLDNYLEKTNLDYINKYFKNNKTSLMIFYRRKFEEGYKQVLMEMIPASDYTDDNQNLFLYVKTIDK